MPSSVLQPVLQYLGRKPGQAIYVSELAAETNLKEDQIKSAISTARSRNPEIFRRVKVIVPGFAWEYSPKSTSADDPPTTAADRIREPAPAAKAVVRKQSRPKGRLFEFLAEAKDGALVIQEEDGTLWRATQI